MKVFHQPNSLVFLPFHPNAQSLTEYQFSCKFPLDLQKGQSRRQFLCQENKTPSTMLDYFFDYSPRRGFEKREFYIQCVDGSKPCSYNFPSNGSGTLKCTNWFLGLGQTHFIGACTACIASKFLTI